MNMVGAITNAEDNDRKLTDALARGLKISKAAWVKAGCPRIYDNSQDETGKIAIAHLAGELLPHILDSMRNEKSDT
mgnify:CR=1 FL=1